MFLSNFQSYLDKRSKGGPVTRYYSHCKDCRGWSKQGRGLAHGYVRKSLVEKVFFELESRVGVSETCRRTGLTIQGYRYFKLTGTRVQKRTAIAAIEALREARSRGEVRHKQSIRRGSYLRGEQERVPEKIHHYYNGINDAEAARSRRRRGSVAA